MKIQNIISIIEDFAPIAFQESYDNSGFLIGDKNAEISGILLTTDVTFEVLQEAKSTNCNLIIAHHPLIFKALNKITNSNDIEKSIIYAIKNDIAVYAAHTNIDVVKNGVSYKMAEKLKLNNIECLAPNATGLNKIICFVPKSHAEIVREAMFDGGGGNIGNYDKCSYNTTGYGTFRANENANPFVGKKGNLHKENEIRIETIVHKARLPQLIQKMLAAHPYEEVAYDIIPLANNDISTGLGVIGNLENQMSKHEFIEFVKKTFNSKKVKVSINFPQKIKTIALCGGSGSSLISTAIAKNADAFITADISYHNFFYAHKHFGLLDIGHYESEQFTKEIFYDLISKINPKFAVQFSNINTNPIKFI